MSSDDSTGAKQSPPQREKVWWGLAYYVRKDFGRWVFRPRWGLVSLLSCSLLVLAYLSLVGGTYWLNKYYRDFENTSLRDMFYYVIPQSVTLPWLGYFNILPSFLDEKVIEAKLSHREKIGNKLFEDPRNIYDLRNAAHLAPKNLQAQFTIARLFLNPDYGLNRINDGVDILDRALPYVVEAPDAHVWLQQYAHLCFLVDQDKRIIATAEQWLDDGRLSPMARITLATSYAEALFLRGDMKKSLALIERYNLNTTLPGFLLNIMIMWESGEQKQTIAMLSSYIERLEKSDPDKTKEREQMLYALARFYWEQGRHDEAAATLDRIAVMLPSDYKPRIYMLPLLAGEANKERRSKIANGILRDFGTKESAMLFLGSYASEQGDYELQKNIYRLAGENRFSSLPNFRLLIIETLLSAGRGEETLDQIKELFIQKPGWLRRNPRIQEQFEALRMLAYFATKQDDLGIITFDKILADNRMSVPMMVSVARRLSKLDHPNEAKSMLVNAYTKNHYHPGVLLELVKIDLQSESTITLSEHLSRLLESRRPPRQVLENAYTHLISDRFLFTPNRDKLLDTMENMLRTRVLGKSETPSPW
ncbi:MAG: hypothetical protein LBV54_00930 [Puniceicoccales bacterium]|jgi:tetratricopeptide (TPR) repeat protein|nr:hypothetical protein [Puniceicoccales bacterium]